MTQRLRSVGTQNKNVASATDWMRIFYAHARAVDHISGQLLEEMPAAQSLFYRQLETWRTGFSDDDFSVVDGLIFFQKPENLSDPGLFFRTFRLIAQRGFKLSPTAEHQMELARPQIGRGSSTRRRFLAVSGRYAAGTAFRGRAARNAFPPSADPFPAGVAGN